MFVSSQQRGSLAGASQSRGGFSPQLFALQADGLRHHQRRGGEVVRRRLLLMSAVDVTGDEQGDLPYLMAKHNTKACQPVVLMVPPWTKFTL